MSYEKRAIWVAPVLLWLLSAAVYWGAQDNQSLTEDTRVVWANPSVSGPDLKGALLGRYEFDPNETDEAVRPVATMANRLRHDVMGDDRGSFVWNQVTLHALCGTLLCALILATLGSPVAALLSGAVFVVHPLMTSSVLSLAGVAEQLALGFGLLALLTLNGVLRDPARRGSGALLAAVLLFLAIGSKEAAFLFLPVSLVWILSCHLQGRKAVGAWRVRYVLGILTIGVLGLIFRMASMALLPSSLRAAPAVHPDTGVGFLDRALIGLASIPTHLQLLIYPQSLSYTYDFLPEQLRPHFPWFVVAGAVVLVLLASGTVVLSVRRRSSAGLWVGFFTFSLVASLGFVAPIGDFLNERTGYFLLPALLGAASLGLLSLKRTYDHRWVGISVVTASMLLIGGYSIRTIARVGDYKDQDSLILSTIDSIDSAQAHYDLGNLFLSRGQYPSARSQYEIALEKNPELWMAWINLGAAFSREEDFSLAMRAYTKALDGAGDRPEYRVPMAKAHFNRAIIFMRQDRNEEAVADLLQTVAVLPDHLRAHASLAFIYRNSPAYDEQALEHFRRAIELETNPEARQKLEEATDYIYERQAELEREKDVRTNATQPPDSPSQPPSSR